MDESIINGISVIFTDLTSKTSSPIPKALTSIPDNRLNH